jgi:hypothetical protein
VTNKDMPAVEVARYAAPRVRPVPVTEVISSQPLDERSRPGGYQKVLLATRTGELRFHENTQHLEPWDPAWTAINDVPRATWNRWHPGTRFSGVGPHRWFEPVPELLSWPIDSGVAELPYLDVAAANALLEELAPYAQALLDGLFDAAGDLDWSADSARAGRNIARLCSHHRQAARPEVDADLVDYARIVARFPQVYRPELLRMPLDKLASECESITRFLGPSDTWHAEIKKVFGTPHRDGSGVGLKVLGVRAWYRTVLLDGDPRPVREFADWDAEHGRLAAGEITSSTTDTDVDAWADREDERAARQGWRLLGAQEAAHSHRAQLRARDWDRLAVVGADVARLEDELEPKRAERLRLVTEAIGWDRSDSEIATRARVSRQAVHKIRGRITSEKSKTKAK